MPLFLRSARGDTSVLLTFLILAALLLGAIALTVLSIGNLRGAGNIAASSQALYAADTGIERGLNEYRWSDPRSPICARLRDISVGSGSYDLTVQDHDRSCPTFQQLQPPPGENRALCIEAVGKTRGGAVRRRVTNDTDTRRCDAVR